MRLRTTGPGRNREELQADLADPSAAPHSRQVAERFGRLMC